MGNDPFSANFLLVAFKRDGNYFSLFFREYSGTLERKGSNKFARLKIRVILPRRERRRETRRRNNILNQTAFSLSTFEFAILSSATPGQRGKNFWDVICTTKK